MRTGRIVDWALAAFCVAMLVLMWIFISLETVPYHFLFLAVAMVYGFRVWQMKKTIVVTTVITVATGAMFLRAYLSGIVGLDETTEVVLMPLLLMAMVWHARRRERAMREVRRMAEVNKSLLLREQEFLRETSHAIRTPMTIARGYVDMAVAETTEPEIAEHLEVVSRQLDRTETLSSRLLSLSALDSDPEAHVDMLDLAAVCRRLAKEWTAAENREWVLEVCSPVWILADVSGIEAAIDAMIENAIHFTAPGMAIRVTCRKIDGFALVEVADSGPGIDEADRPFVFERFWHRTPPDGVVGSGLGLSMVAAVAQAHGGYATAGTAQEGGASISMTFARPTASEDAAPSPASSCHDIELDASSVSTVPESSTSPAH